MTKDSALRRQQAVATGGDSSASPVSSVGTASDGSLSGRSPANMSRRRSSIGRPGEMNRWFGPLISSSPSGGSNSPKHPAPSPTAAESTTPPPPPPPPSAKPHGGLALVGRAGDVAATGGGGRFGPHPSAAAAGIATTEAVAAEKQKSQVLRARSAAKAKLLTGYEKSVQKRGNLLFGVSIEELN